MTGGTPPGGRKYPVAGPTGPVPPSYERVAKGLSDRELREEIDAGRGSDEYRQALAAELDRRSR